jgi:site-specific DNA recombinase
MRRAAKYKRISRDREGRELGIQRQDQDLNGLAERHDLVVAGDYFDNDLSASRHARKPRPDYEQMLKDARTGRFDVIIAYTMGRLTRRPREFEDLIDLATDYGIEFQYVRSPSFDLRTAQGREIARTMAARDAGEAEELAERVQRQKVQAAESGGWRGGRRPYGYGVPIGTKRVYSTTAEDWVDKPIYDCYKLAEDEAEEIAHATREILLGGSLRGLAASLNERGKLTSTGHRWTATELRRVLRRARNAGLIEVTKDDGTVEVLEGVTAQWPAIVTEAEWRACLAILDDPDRRTNKTNSAKKWLGSGLYRCAVCQGTVRATRASGHNGNNPLVYRCTKESEKGKLHVARRVDYTDEVVEGAVLGWLIRPGVAQHLRQRTAVDVAVLKAQEGDLGRKLVEIDDMFNSGETDRAGRLRMRSKELTKLEEIKAQIAAAVEVDPVAELLAADDIVDAWKKLTIPKKQTIVDAICTVTLHPGKKGRPPGWKPGERYFDPRTVEVKWR